jgi:hypothetical protein
MGKGILITVLLALFGVGGLLYGMRDTLFRSEAKLIKWEEEILAREIARSAYNLALSRLKREPGWRSGWPARPYGEGTMEVSIQEAGSGLLELVATGRYRSATAQIRGRVSLSTGFPATVTMDVFSLTAAFSGGAFRISGYDQRPPSLGGGAGPGPHTHALWSTSQAGASSLLAALARLPSSAVSGIGGTPDVHVGSLPWNLTELLQEVEQHATESYTGPRTFVGNRVFGSPSQPTIMVVNGDAVFSGSVSGYGVLLVKGSLTLSGTFSWEGLVMVEGRGPSQVVLSGNPAIYGALVMRSADPGLPGGHFDVDIFDRPNSTEVVYHKHQYDDAYDVTYVDLLADSRLRWDLVQRSGARRIRIELINTHNHGMGTLTFDAGSGPQQIPLPSSFSVTLAPTQLRALRIDFRALGALRGTEPKRVQRDPSGRDGALSVRVYNADKGQLIYELSVYHHVKEDGTPEDNPGGGLLFSMSGSALIQYSSEALRRLGALLPSLRNAGGLLVLEEIEK